MGKKKKEKTIDTEYSIPITCAVCKKCWLNPRTHVCLYGGPYTGYYDDFEK